jgi:hypothetical protein
MIKKFKEYFEYKYTEFEPGKTYTFTYKPVVITSTRSNAAKYLEQLDGFCKEYLEDQFLRLSEVLNCDVKFFLPIKYIPSLKKDSTNSITDFFGIKLELDQFPSLCDSSCVCVEVSKNISIDRKSEIDNIENELNSIKNRIEREYSQVEVIVEKINKFKNALNKIKSAEKIVQADIRYDVTIKLKSVK